MCVVYMYLRFEFYRTAGLCWGSNFRDFRGSVAVRESNIHEFCIAYKVWLIQNAIREILLVKYANANN